MSKHTPAPWSLGSPGDGEIGSVYCDNSLGSRIAIVYGPAQKFTIFPREEEEANARLIAAAPDLLEALEAMFAEGAGCPYATWTHAQHLAHDAICRAKGETP